MDSHGQSHGRAIQGRSKGLKDDGLHVYIVQLPLTQRENIVAVFLCFGARQRRDSTSSDSSFASAFGSDVKRWDNVKHAPTTCRTQIEDPYSSYCQGLLSSFRSFKVFCFHRVPWSILKIPPITLDEVKLSAAFRYTLCPNARNWWKS